MFVLLSIEKGVQIEHSLCWLWLASILLRGGL